MGVYSLNNTAQRIDQAVNAVHSGSFVNGTGVVYTGGNQTIAGNKTFVGNTVIGNFSTTGVSGNFIPASSGDTNIGSSAKPFATGFVSVVNASSGSFTNLTVTNLNANINIGATGLSSISVTGTGYIQNLRTTGTSFLNGAVTINGAITSTGNNSWSGQNSFSNSSFSETPILQKGIVVTGVANFVSGFTSGPISGSVFYQTGNATMSGALVHSGSINQVGDSVFVGAASINGTATVSGSFNVSGGSTTIRSSTLFTTGSSASDRFGVIQNVDVTGDLNITGAVRISSALNVTGNQTNLGTLTVKNTGYFDGARVSGNLYSSGASQLTGNNSFLGNNFISGTTSVSGNITFSNVTGQAVRFDSFVRNRIIASGIGTATVTALNIASFFASNGNAVAPGTGIWLTQYTGQIGEEGIFLTGSSTSVANNNNLPVGTFGKVFKLINVGITGGSGVWYPLGV